VLPSPGPAHEVVAALERAREARPLAVALPVPRVQLDIPRVGRAPVHDRDEAVACPDGIAAFEEDPAEVTREHVATMRAARLRRCDRQRETEGPSPRKPAMPRRRTNHCPKCGFLNLARTFDCEHCGAMTSRAITGFKTRALGVVFALVGAGVAWWTITDALRSLFGGRHETQVTMPVGPMAGDDADPSAPVDAGLDARQFVRSVSQARDAPREHVERPPLQFHARSVGGSISRAATTTREHPRHEDHDL
jgi:hypothetical protein